MNSLNAIKSIIIGLVLVLFPVAQSYAAAGCCSHHGGVVGCNTGTGHLQCKDGSASPSCPCTGVKVKTSKKPVTTAPAAATVPAAAATTTTTTKTVGKGCCARHGGVGKCNKTTGLVTCKDGSQSATCKCS